jgi:hypothetical protein
VAKSNLQGKSKTVHWLLLRQSSRARGKHMLNLTTRTQKLIQMGLTLAFGAMLFLSGSAGAADQYPSTDPPKDDYSYCTKFEQVYAYTEFFKEPYQQLDVVCSEGYRAISCEAELEGKEDYDYSKHYLSLSDLAPRAFKKSEDGKYEHATSDATYWGCYISANNNLLYFTPSYHTQYDHDFFWRITGYATCVPKDCVNFYETSEYYPDYGYPSDY